MYFVAWAVKLTVAATNFNFLELKASTGFKVLISFLYGYVEGHMTLNDFSWTYYFSRVFECVRDFKRESVWERVWESVRECVWERKTPREREREWEGACWCMIEYTATFRIASLLSTCTMQPKMLTHSLCNHLMIAISISLFHSLCVYIYKRRPIAKIFKVDIFF